jgi:hypothetical protein
VIRQTIRDGARAGAVAAAAIAGALIALGRAHGAAMQPMNAMSHIVVGSRAYYMERFGALTLVAIVIFVVAVMAWAIALSLLTGRLRGRSQFAAALVFAGATWFVDAHLATEKIRPGFEMVLSGAEIAFVYLLLGASTGWALDRERNKT